MPKDILQVGPLQWGWITPQPSTGVLAIVVDREHEGTNAFANVPHTGADVAHFRIRIFVLHAEEGCDRIDKHCPKPNVEPSLHFLTKGL
jgi:hypothetical protein